MDNKPALNTLLSGRRRKSWRRPRNNSRLGAATVEFALIAPLMIMFTFGMIEMGRMLMVKNAATQATREGARAGSLPMATDQQVLARVQEELELLSISSAVIETFPASISQALPGETIMVRVRIDPDSVSWAPTFFPFEIPDIVAESTMRKESTN